MQQDCKSKDSLQHVLAQKEKQTREAEGREKDIEGKKQVYSDTQNQTVRECKEINISGNSTCSFRKPQFYLKHLAFPFVLGEICYGLLLKT